MTQKPFSIDILFTVLIVYLSKEPVVEIVNCDNQDRGDGLKQTDAALAEKPFTVKDFCGGALPRCWSMFSPV